MAHKVIWSPEAVVDLTEIRDFIARDSESYAAAVIERMLAAVERLSDFPRMGVVVPELHDDSIHQLIVDRYRIIYRISAQSVAVAAVVHGTRDLPAALAHRGIA
jgi:toxin ParE1/3/4